MLLKVYLLIVATVAVVQAESPRRAPYAAAGWRPEVPFNLPGELLVSSVGDNYEISKQRVEHAGTFNVPQRNPNYLSTQFNVPKGEQQEQQEQQTQSPLPSDSRTPSSQYGAPTAGDFRIIYPEEESSQSPSQSSIKEGRYYIVSPDNKLQQVLYRTEEAQGDEFTAQLKYRSVGELQDAVYKYNTQGHLERVLK